MIKQKNELSVKFLSVLGLNFTPGANSSSRQSMFASHLSQMLVIKGATERRIQTGMEQEFGKYTFKQKMPATGKILRIVPLYPPDNTSQSIKENPLVTVVYEDMNTREIGSFNLERYTSYHQHFGFENVQMPGYNSIILNQTIEKDTVFMDSPNIRENGGYAYGIELNVAFMSHPAVSEDGVLISSDVLPKLAFKVREKRTVRFGQHEFPLNLYGDEHHYKIMPDIGETIPDHGILMATRSYDEMMAPVEMSVWDTMEVDPVFDNTVYVRGPGGKVIDIRVMSNAPLPKYTPPGMDSQIEKYFTAQQLYYKALLETEQKLRANHKRKYNEDKLSIKPEFHRLLVEAMGMTDGIRDRAKVPLNKIYKKEPLDDYQIEITVEYEVIPKEGFKLTGTHGDKGVICRVVPPERMPVDKAGNRADVVMDSGSTVNRMNIGRFYEHYLGCLCRDLAAEIRNSLPDAKAQLERRDYIALERAIYQLPEEIFEKTYQRILRFYEIVSEKQFKFFSEEVTSEEKRYHLLKIMRNGIFIYYPPDNQVEPTEWVRKLEEEFNPVYGPVTYIGDSGQKVTTVENVRIGPTYLILLEKIADSWSAVSSGKLQHFGIVSHASQSDRHLYPWRNSAVKTIGETEGRLYASYCGVEAIAEMLDRANNPATHRMMVQNILSAPEPGNIESSVDRNLIPLGNSKPLQLINHMLMCAGWKWEYVPEKKD